MFIPIRTDRPPKRTPVVTQTLILLNLAVYLLGVAGTFFGLFENPQRLADLGHFDPGHFRAWQLLTYQFLHDPYGLLHIAFNMLFLWVFGAAVEDRLGRPGFAAFYLAGGAVAALAHAAASPSPVIGASGAVCGVTGAFLALFPRARIQVVVFFFFIGVFSIPSLWFIGFYAAIDLLRQIGDLLGGGGSQVAYMAHLAGYAYGFTVAFSLLAGRVLKREEFDIFYIFTQARRRATFRAASRQGPAGLWDSAQADTGQRIAREAARRKEQPRPEDDDSRRTMLRAEINRLLAEGRLKPAAEAYRKLLADVPPPTADPQTREAAASGMVLAEQRQLDVASQLYSDGRHADAARAYELLIGNYPTSPKADEVRLILAILYGRHLELPQRARELIEQAKPRLHSASHVRLADQLLAELAT